MKILGISASPRKGGNTDIVINEVLNSAKDEGAEVEFLTLAGKEINSCVACDNCKKTGKCVYDDDVLPILEKISEADGVVIGSPVYFGNVPSQLKALIDRERVIGKKWGSFDGKVGASVAVAWKWGHVNTLETIDTFYTVNKMIITGNGGVPGIGMMVFAKDKGEVKENEEALKSAQALGKRIVETVNKYK